MQGFCATPLAAIIFARPRVMDLESTFSESSAVSTTTRHDSDLGGISAVVQCLLRPDYIFPIRSVCLQQQLSLLLPCIPECNVS